MTTQEPAIQIAQRTERGPRETNQDRVLVRPLPGGGWLVAVADGMGGLEAGEIASKTAMDVFERQVLAGRPLISAVEDANAAVLERADEIPMGTTLVAALIRDNDARIVNVGDSRAYRLGREGLSQITRDHTVRAEAELNGQDAGSDPASERWSNALTRSLGAGLEVHVDEFGPMRLQPGDRLLLCSDGLHGVLTEADIEEGLSQPPDARAAVDRLMDTALEADTHDNVSSVVVTIQATAKPTGTGVTRQPTGESAGPEAATKKPSTSSGRKRTIDQPWNPAKLASLSHRPLTRKPNAFGRLALGAVAVILIAAAVYLILA